MVLFCEHHFKYEATHSHLMRFYTPQTQARHVVDAECLLTFAEVRALFTQFVVAEGEEEVKLLVKEAALLYWMLEKELETDQKLSTFK